MKYYIRGEYGGLSKAIILDFISVVGPLSETSLKPYDRNIFVF
jgi:hypothetical protein